MSINFSSYMYNLDVEKFGSYNLIIEQFSSYNLNVEKFWSYNLIIEKPFLLWLLVYLILNMLQ